MFLGFYFLDLLAVGSGSRRVEKYKQKEHKKKKKKKSKLKNFDRNFLHFHFIC